METVFKDLRTIASNFWSFPEADVCFEDDAGSLYLASANVLEFLYPWRTVRIWEEIPTVHVALRSL